MSGLKEYFDKGVSITEFSTNYFEYLKKILDSLDVKIIEKIIRTLIKAGENGNTVFFLGNGGSAAIASHFASDLSMNTRADGYNKINAVSLVDNIPALTAISNDEGYENIFIRQLEIQMKADDVVVALSVSGNSSNVLKATEFAYNNGAVTVGLTANDSGKIHEFLDISLFVKTLPGEYGPVEDVFQILDHLIYSYLRLDRVGYLTH